MSRARHASLNDGVARHATGAECHALGMLPGTFVYVYLGAAGQGLGHGNRFTPLHWALLGIGLVATAAASLYIARAAQRRLERRKAA